MAGQMACFCVISSNGFLISQENLRIHVGKTKSLWGNNDLHSLFSSLSYSCDKSQYGLLWNNTGVSSSGFGYCQKSAHKLFCKNEIRPLVSRNKRAHVTEKTNNGRRKKFSLRMSPRWRLLCARFRKFSIRSMLNDIGTFIRKHVKNLALSALITIALGVCYLFLKFTSIPSPKLVPYSDLITSIEKGSVDKVLIEEGSRRIYYNTNSQNLENLAKIEDESSLNDVPGDNVADIIEGKDGKNVFKKYSRSRPANPEWQFSARKIDHDEKFLLSLMREKGTSYSSAPQSVIESIRSVLLIVLTLWIPLTPLMWILYRQLSAANSPAKKRKPNNQMVTFDDVEGVDTAKIELMEIVMCMQGSINYKKLGAKLPGGVLLVGSPGTGKTLLARAVAGEAGVPFFSVSASEFVELFVGRGAARIRDLFKVARKYSPSIIFIDELDAVGGKRGRSFNDERDQTLNQLLTEMDGFESDMKVVVIAATNRPESLDPALCRPGRFSRKVIVGEPDEDGRRKILAVHLRGIPLEEDTPLICNLIASLTPRFVGADLANIVNEAALLAARRGSETVMREDIMEAIERAKFGINDKRVSQDRISKELRRLFPWMKPLIEKNDTRPDGGLEGPLGYQSLS